MIASPYGVSESYKLTCRAHPRRGRAKIWWGHVVTTRYFFVRRINGRDPSFAARALPVV